VRAAWSAQRSIVTARQIGQLLIACSITYQHPPPGGVLRAGVNRSCRCPVVLLLIMSQTLSDGRSMTESFWQELGGTLFEEAGDALFLFDPESEQLRTVNPMAQRLSGFNRRDLVEMKVSQLIRSEADGGLQRMRQAFRRTGIFHSQEGFWLRQRDGRWLPVNLTITRLHADSQVHGLITARDISERRDAQARLQESEQRYRALFETSLQGIIIHQDGIIRFGNAALARMFGYGSVEELVGRDIWKTLVMPHEWPELHERTARFLAGDKLEPHPGWQGIRQDGSVIWIQATASLVPWNGRPAICAFFLDMTERKRAEEALQASESRHRLILEQVPAIIWTTDAELRITSNNGAGLGLIGQTPGDSQGQRKRSAPTIRPSCRWPPTSRRCAAKRSATRWSGAAAPGRPTSNRCATPRVPSSARSACAWTPPNASAPRPPCAKASAPWPR